VAACGALLYSGGEVLDDSPDVAPTGHAEIDTIDPADGTEATLNWDNISQDGDETLEVWMRPDGGAWLQVVPNGLYGGSMISSDLDVSLAASQSLDLDGLEIGLDYDVAIRYRRGSQYHVDYSSDDPSDWPAASRTTFNTTPVAPVLDSLEWTRTSATIERIRVSFTPAADHEVLVHEVLRDSTPIGTIPAGTFVYDDYGITGETVESYEVRAVAHGHNSALSNTVALWAGPPAPVSPVHDGGAAGACDPGDAAYAISWTAGDITLPTQVFEDSVVVETAPAGDEFAVGICADESVPDLAVRHAQTLYAVTDYSTTVVVAAP
jgi:hypothetical protein